MSSGLVAIGIISHQRSWIFDEVAKFEKKLIRFLSADQEKMKIFIGLITVVIVENLSIGVALAHPLYYRHPYHHPRRIDYYDEVGYENAISVCQSFTRSTTKNNCLTAIRNSIYIQPDAVDSCLTSFKISPKIIDCFTAIKDRSYDYSEILECNNYVSRRDKLLQCLSSSGKKVESRSQRE